MNYLILITLSLTLILQSCNNNMKKYNDDLIALSGRQIGIPVKLPPFNPDKHIPEIPDYNKSDCWVSLPKYFDTTQKPVDVFWVYPTILSDDTTYLMDIFNCDLRKKAEWTIVEQASVFDRQANIYAPYYRQNNVKINPLMLTEAKPIFSLGQHDLIQAFSYFMQNINKGERPVIIAGHSQGSVRIVELSKDKQLLMKDSTTRAKMIATYAIGYSITNDDIKVNPLIEIAESAKQTQCFIAYNTISNEPGKEKEGPTIIPGTYVVNPLSWKSDTTFCPASLNTEAVFFNHQNPQQPQKFKNFAAAQKKGNALVITDISNPEMLPATSVTFPQGVYHMYDYAIFYNNIRNNIKERIDSYFNGKK